MAKSQKKSNREAKKPKAEAGSPKNKTPKYMEFSNPAGQTSALFNTKRAK